jgi:hypothetical protein
LRNKTATRTPSNSSASSKSPYDSSSPCHGKRDCSCSSKGGLFRRSNPRQPCIPEAPRRPGHRRASAFRRNPRTWLIALYPSGYQTDRRGSCRFALTGLRTRQSTSGGSSSHPTSNPCLPTPLFPHSLNYTSVPSTFMLSSFVLFKPQPATTARFSPLAPSQPISLSSLCELCASALSHSPLRHRSSVQLSLQNCTFVFNNLQVAPPATPLFSDFCIVAGGCTPPLPISSLLTIHCSLPTAHLSPLECAVLDKYRVLPGLGRSCPHVSPLECAVPKNVSASPLECADAKKVGGHTLQARNRSSPTAPLTHPAAQCYHPILGTATHD